MGDWSGWRCEWQRPGAGAFGSPGNAGIGEIAEIAGTGEIAEIAGIARIAGTAGSGWLSPVLYKVEMRRGRGGRPGRPGTPARPGRPGMPGGQGGQGDRGGLGGYEENSGPQSGTRHCIAHITLDRFDPVLAHLASKSLRKSMINQINRARAD